MRPNLAEPFAAELETILRNTSVDAWSTYIATIRSQPTSSTYANEWWYLRQVAGCRRSYLLTLDAMRRGEYFEAWCSFESIELALRDLLNNPVYDAERFAVRELARTVARWQSIFPYRLFASPEIVIKAEDCSICGAPVDPWSDCGHEVGKLYDGDVCHRIVRDFELLSISVVEKPVQKFSVLHPENPAFDYSPLNFVLARLPHPFFEWRVERGTATHPTSVVGPLADDELCPCGSKGPYAACCKGKPSIVLQHLEFWFGDFGDDAAYEVEFFKN